MKKREEVKMFANAMERQLQYNDHKEHWSNFPQEYLFQRLLEEVSELYEAMNEGLDGEDMLDEAADVANFAMMIADINQVKP